MKIEITYKPEHEVATGGPFPNSETAILQYENGSGWVLWHLDANGDPDRYPLGWRDKKSVDRAYEDAKNHLFDHGRKVEDD